MLLVLAACGAGRRGGEPARPGYDVADQPHVSTADPAGGTAPAPAAGAATSTEPAAGGETPPAPAVYVPDAATLERLGWPATTVSYELRRAAHAYAAPDLDAAPLGKILEGMRLPVRASVDGDKRCKVWLAAEPTGWLCARHAKPSTKAPELVPQPVVPPGQILPQQYYSIREGASRYATEDDVRAGYARPEPKTKSTYMVTRDDEARVEIDGVTYETTPVGLVATTDLIKEKPTTFGGVDLVATPPPGWPFAWIIAPDRKTVTARAAADKKAAAAGTIAHRELVPVLEEANDFVRVGDGQWVPRKAVRIARKRTRPAVAGAPPRWIDLDRDEQVLIAYDGDTPVFATLFSSGRRKKDTPPAVYRLRSKTSLTKMAAEERESSHYEVSEVPWATRFRSGLYFHAAYWHDRFGDARSHGCVNLSPRDARWVYEWTQPTMPPGWNELEIDLAGAMVVRVYDAKNPDPPEFDYEREAKERAKLRKEEEALRKAREAAEAIDAVVEGAARRGAVPATPAPAPPAPAPAP
jgi:lipoprotein-anchoring transpeptidase ErfK/SrfK